QKVVIKISSMYDDRSRRKAMEIAVSSVPGVTLVELQGDEKNQIAVTGDGIDLTCLSVKIRKKIGYTEIVSVTPIPEKPKEKKPDDKKPDEKPSVQPIFCQHGTPAFYWSEARHPNPDPCTILLDQYSTMKVRLLDNIFWQLYHYQKIVIKISMNGDKSRTKAMKIAVGVTGVTSAELQGDSKNQIVVIGDGIDSTCLTKLIRKKVGFTELVSVTPIPEKKEEKPKVKNEPAAQAQEMVWTPYQYGYGTPHIYVSEVPHHHEDNCSIM
ncbi:hypothetical protein AQUCO_06800093v1, partial [Aquilegia coerulea]